MKNWWNTGYFLLLWKDFSTDQYVLRLVDGSINFLDKQEYLSLDTSMEPLANSEGPETFQSLEYYCCFF